METLSNQWIIAIVVFIVTILLIVAVFIFRRSGKKEPCPQNTPSPQT